MHYLLLNSRYRQNCSFISETRDISTKITGKSPKMGRYIDENCRYISENKGISTKLQVYLRKWRVIDENTGISPKMEIYRRKQQVYLRK